MHGTNNEISGTAAYKYGMDVLFTVHCQLCRADVEGTGDVGGRGNPHRRVHYERADPAAWWRKVLQTLESHGATVGHVGALAAWTHGQRGR